MLLNLRLRTLCTGLNCVGDFLPCHLVLKIVSETLGSVPNTKQHTCSEFIMQTIPFYCVTGAGVWHSFVKKWFTRNVRRDKEIVLTENWVMLGTWRVWCDTDGGD